VATNVQLTSIVELRTGLHSRRTQMNIAFLCICLALVAVNSDALHAWLQMSISGEQSVDFWIIPLISAFLCYERRNAIFARMQFNPVGFVPLVLGIGICTAGHTAYFAHVGSNMIIVILFGTILSIAGAFLMCYGMAACHEARFPLGILLLAIPLPQAAWDQLIHWLQNGSATVVDLLFLLFKVPFLRDGLTFHLSGLSIEIAPECSGIRSSFALMVFALLLAHFALRSFVLRLVLVSAVIPLVIVKNGMRIVTIALLSIRVDPAFINGSLHRHGGFVFFTLVLAAEGTLCWLLRRSELQWRLGAGEVTQ